MVPATAEELHHKFIFVTETLSKMGLPLMEDDDRKIMTENFIKNISLKYKPNRRDKEWKKIYLYGWWGFTVLLPS